MLRRGVAAIAALTPSTSAQKPQSNSRPSCVLAIVARGSVDHSPPRSACRHGSTGGERVCRKWTTRSTHAYDEGEPWYGSLTPRRLAQCLIRKASCGARSSICM